MPGLEFKKNKEKIFSLLTNEKIYSITIFMNFPGCVSRDKKNPKIKKFQWRSI
jgi:hypothetical protein